MFCWPQVLDSLVDAMTPPSPTPTSGAPSSGAPDAWSTRAAALSFAQNWWFRTCFLLPPAQTSQLVQLVQERLADAKVGEHTSSASHRVYSAFS